MFQHLDCKLLNTFIAVCEEGSLNKASTRLHYAQSTVSSQIINLENTIGKKLFDREKNKIILTTIGKEVLLYAYKFMDLQNDLKESIDYLERIKGVIKITALESFLSTTLPKVMHDFNIKYKDINFLLMPGFIDNMTQSLITREIDFAIFPTRPKDPILDFEFLYTEKLVFIGSKQFVDGLQSGVENKNTLRFISFGTECIYSKLASKHLREQGYLEYRKMNSFSIEGIKQMVSCGIGISLVPERYVIDELKNDRIKIMPDMPILKIDVGIVKLKDHNLSKSAELFKAFLINNISNILEVYPTIHITL